MMVPTEVSFSRLGEESCQADVSLLWHRGGHELGNDDIEPAQKWLMDNVLQKLAAQLHSPQLSVDRFF